MDERHQGLITLLDWLTRRIEAEDAGIGPDEDEQPEEVD